MRCLTNEKSDIDLRPQIKQMDADYTDVAGFFHLSYSIVVVVVNFIVLYLHLIEYDVKISEYSWLLTKAVHGLC